MAATQPQALDRTAAEGKPAEPDNIMEQGAAPIGHTRDSASHSGTFGSGGDHTVYPPHIYAPQAQAFYYRGYDGATGDWDEYPSYINAEGLEIGSSAAYSDNHSLLFHSGYGYNPQMPYGPYSPVMTPLPSVGGDAQLYSPQQFPFSGPPYYQQLVPHSMPYMTSPTPVSQPEVATLMGVDDHSDGRLFGPRPGYPSVESLVRGGFPGNAGRIGFHDSQQGFDGLRSGGVWSDWPKTADRERSFTPLSPIVSPQAIGAPGSFGQNFGMVSQSQRSSFGFVSGANSYNRSYLPSGFNQGYLVNNTSISSSGTNNRGSLSFEASRRRAKGSGALCSCNNSLDILSEQNRGPRASKLQSQITSDNSSLDSRNQRKSTAKIQDETYNRQDFITEYKDAKFFIIKSYTEDNVHKSIKYGIWASTPNGNRKLDAAYRESKQKENSNPVFLFFSVNASAQFCGVAEMVGPIDFDRSVDYWQQDKWSGQFPVKWHIIKDVPNSQFRHIVLENNDNKPVTNSRDTQEVKLEQGIEMLKIFKNYETDTSILDDFEFYEERQKAMQERKARQLASLMAPGVLEENEHRSLSSGYIKQMSKSFAQVVCLDEGSKESTVPDKASSASDGSTGTRLKLEDGVAATVSSALSG